MRTQRATRSGQGLLAAAWFGAAGLALTAAPALGDGPAGTVPVQAALAAYFTTAQQVQLSAHAANPKPVRDPKAAKDAAPAEDAYSLQYTSAPQAGVTPFREQTQAHSAVQTLAVTKNGAPLSTSTATAYFLVNPYVPVGRVNSSGSPYAVIINQYELPVAAAPGARGPFYNMTWYHDADMSAVDGFMTATYSVEPGEAGAGRVCVTIEISRVTAQGTSDGLAEGSQVNCYGIGVAGKATLASVDMSVAGQPLSFR